MSTAIENLKTSMNNHLKDIETTIKSYPWADQGVYADWCAQTYKFVCHTVPLLNRATELSEGALRELMQEHSKEEFGHEKFAFQDAKYLGLNAEEAPTYEPTKAFYESVYAAEKNGDFIEVLMGYAACLEQIAAKYGDFMAEEAMKASGIQLSKNPNKCIPASFLVLHAVVDKEHAEHGIHCLEEHFSEEQLQRIQQHMEWCFANYREFLSAILEQNKAVEAA